MEYHRCNAGILLHRTPGVVGPGNTIVDSPQGIHILDTQQTVEIINNADPLDSSVGIVNSADIGVLVEYSQQVNISGNTIIGAGADGIRYYGGHGVVDKNRILDSGRWGISAEASWGIPTSQDARPDLNAANDVDAYPIISGNVFDGSQVGAIHALEALIVNNNQLRGTSVVSSACDAASNCYGSEPIRYLQQWYGLIHGLFRVPPAGRQSALMQVLDPDDPNGPHDIFGLYPLPIFYNADGTEDRSVHVYNPDVPMVFEVDSDGLAPPLHLKLNAGHGSRVQVTRSDYVAWPKITQTLVSGSGQVSNPRTGFAETLPHRIEAVAFGRDDKTLVSNKVEFSWDGDLSNDPDYDAIESVNGTTVFPLGANSMGSSGQYARFQVMQIALSDEAPFVSLCPVGEVAEPAAGDDDAEQATASNCKNIFPRPADEEPEPERIDIVARELLIPPYIAHDPYEAVLTVKDFDRNTDPLLKETLSVNLSFLDGSVSGQSDEALELREEDLSSELFSETVTFVSTAFGAPDRASAALALSEVKGSEVKEEHVFIVDPADHPELGDLGDRLRITYADPLGAEDETVNAYYDVYALEPKKAPRRGTLTFVNTVGEPTETVSCGQTLRVRIEDEDANQTAAVRETISVRFYNVSLGSSETERGGSDEVTIAYEQGLDSEVFIAAVEFQCGPPVSGDALLQGSPGHSINAVYQDNGQPRKQINDVKVSAAPTPGLLELADASGTVTTKFSPNESIYVTLSDPNQSRTHPPRTKPRERDRFRLWDWLFVHTGEISSHRPSATESTSHDYYVGAAVTIRSFVAGQLVDQEVVEAPIKIGPDVGDEKKPYQYAIGGMAETADNSGIFKGVVATTGDGFVGRQMFDGLLYAPNAATLAVDYFDFADTSLEPERLQVVGFVKQGDAATIEQHETFRLPARQVMFYPPEKDSRNRDISTLRESCYQLDSKTTIVDNVTFSNVPYSVDLFDTTARVRPAGVYKETPRSEIGCSNIKGRRNDEITVGGGSLGVNDGEVVNVAYAPSARPRERAFATSVACRNSIANIEVITPGALGSVGEPIQSVAEVDSFRIRIYDPNRADKESKVRDGVRVQLSSRNDREEFSAVEVALPPLRLTDNYVYEHDGIFETTVVLNTDGKPQEFDNQLYAEVGDVIEITYVDELAPASDSRLCVDSQTKPEAIKLLPVGAAERNSNIVFLDDDGNELERLPYPGEFTVQLRDVSANADATVRDRRTVSVWVDASATGVGAVTSQPFTLQVEEVFSTDSGIFEGRVRLQRNTTTQPLAFNGVTLLPSIGDRIVVRYQDPEDPNDISGRQAVVLGQQLKLSLRAQPDRGSIGDMTQITLEVENPNDAPVRETLMTLRMFEALQPLEENWRTDTGTVTPERVDDGTYTFAVQPFDGEGIQTFRFMAAVRPDANSGEQEGNADLRRNGILISNLARATFRVEAEPLFTQSTVFGKVFYDYDNDQWQDGYEPGATHAVLYTTRGDEIRTDEYGRFHLPDVKPGLIGLKVDRNSLPLPSEVTPSPAVIEVRPAEPKLVTFAITPASEVIDAKLVNVPWREFTLLDKRSGYVVEAGLSGAFKIGSAAYPLRWADISIVELDEGVLFLKQMAKKNQPLTLAYFIPEPKLVTSAVVNVSTFDGRVLQSWPLEETATEGNVQWPYKELSQQLRDGRKYLAWIDVTYNDGTRARSSQREFTARDDIPTEKLGTASFFEVGSSSLEPKTILELRRAAELLRLYPDAKVIIEGHTDNTGPRDLNIRLSKNRASKGVAYMEIVEGISADRVEVLGYGPTRPIATNQTAEGRARNRRVEVKVEGVPEGLVSETVPELMIGDLKIPLEGARKLQVEFGKEKEVILKSYIGQQYAIPTSTLDILGMLFNKLQPPPLAIY